MIAALRRDETDFPAGDGIRPKVDGRGLAGITGHQIPGNIAREARQRFAGQARMHEAFRDSSGVRA